MGKAYINIVKHNIRIILLLIISSFKLLATEQVRDILIYNGDTLGFESYPLEPILRIIEEDMPKDLKDTRAYLFGLEKEDIMLTSCLRGYIAEWTIIDSQLYLTNIYSQCQRGRKVDLNYLWENFISKIDTKEHPFFENIFVEGKIKANWVNRKIKASQGKVVCRYGFNSILEKEVKFQFENGKLIGTEMYDNSKAKQPEDWQDGRTILNSLLDEYVYKNINWNIIPKLDTEIEILIEFSANENLIIDSIKIIKGYNELLESEAIKAIKAIPEWETTDASGRFKRVPFKKFIIFSEEMREKWSNK